MTSHVCRPPHNQLSHCSIPTGIRSSQNLQLRVLTIHGAEIPCLPFNCRAYSRAVDSMWKVIECQPARISNNSNFHPSIPYMTTFPLFLSLVRTCFRIQYKSQVAFESGRTEWHCVPRSQEQPNHTQANKEIFIQVQ